MTAPSATPLVHRALLDSVACTNTRLVFTTSGPAAVPSPRILLITGEVPERLVCHHDSISRPETNVRDFFSKVSHLIAVPATILSADHFPFQVQMPSDLTTSPIHTAITHG